MIKLYDFSLSPRARKVRITLAAKGLAYEKVPIDITAGAQTTPEYLAINPHGKVPALQDAGTTLYESTVIMEYLNDAYPTPPLLPDDGGQRARARVLMHYADNPYEHAVATLAAESLLKPMRGEATDREVVAQATAALHLCFDHLANELGQNDFLVGSALTLADIPYVAWALLFPRLHVDIPHPRLEAWINRLTEQPSVRAAG